MTHRARRLTNLPQTLIERGFDPPPPYRKLRDAAIGGLFPAEQVNHIWHYHPADIDVIERALRRMCAHSSEKPLGLLDPPDAPSRGKKRDGIAKALAAAAA